MAQFSIGFPKNEVSVWAKRYSYGEDATVKKIGARSTSAGYYTREDSLEVCEWKTRGRPRRHYQRNSEQDVRRATTIVLSSPWNVQLLQHRTGKTEIRTLRRLQRSKKLSFWELRERKDLARCDGRLSQDVGRRVAYRQTTPKNLG